MKNLSIRWLSLVVLSASWSLSDQASATFHTFDIVEVFSSADGLIQFIELFEVQGIDNQHFFGGKSITSNFSSFMFLTNLTSFQTTNKNVLIGTTSYESLAQTDVNVPLPDYVFSDGFIDTTGDTLNFAGVDFLIFTAGDLPTDGTNSLNRAVGTSTFFSATNSPKNFAEDTGTVPSANFDGVNGVDGKDFLIWQRGFGGPGGLSEGDANNDGFVDGDDLAIWEAQYGLPVPLSAISSVPEPQSVCLLLWGLLALSGRRRNAI